MKDVVENDNDFNMDEAVANAAYRLLRLQKRLSGSKIDVESTSADGTLLVAVVFVKKRPTVVGDICFDDTSASDIETFGECSKDDLISEEVARFLAAAKDPGFDEADERKFVSAATVSFWADDDPADSVYDDL